MKTSVNFRIINLDPTFLIILIENDTLKSFWSYTNKN